MIKRMDHLHTKRTYSFFCILHQKGNIQSHILGVEVKVKIMMISNETEISAETLFSSRTNELDNNPVNTGTPLNKPFSTMNLVLPYLFIFLTFSPTQTESVNTNMPWEPEGRTPSLLIRNLKECRLRGEPADK